jgi:hypothetical protein
LQKDGNVFGSWDAHASNYRALAEAMGAALRPRIKALIGAANAAISPETRERTREDADLADQFLAAYEADCEAQAGQFAQWADAADTAVLDDAAVSWPRTASKKRRDEIATTLFSALVCDLAGVGMRTGDADDTALLLLRALLPAQFAGVETAESLSRRRRAANKRNLTNGPA